jgi:rubrerythrin
MDIRKIYEYALQREIEGKKFFEDNASRLSHASAVQVFKLLAGEEQKHINYIQHQLDVMDQEESMKGNVKIDLEDPSFFMKRATSEFIQQTTSEAMVPDLPVFRMAYLIERDFAEFYEKAAKEAIGDAKEVLETLAYWERKHESLFKELHDKAFEEYSGMPWGG